jgi:CheY-like chemotaxis protein
MAPTVLIVGTNPSGLVVARDALARTGHRVLTTATVSQGLRIARAIHPDVLLLDDAAAQMGNVSEFTREAPRSMRIILCVPRGRSEELLAAVIEELSWPLSQVVAVLEKPFDAESLLNAVRGPVDELDDETETTEAGPEVVLSARIGAIGLDQLLQLAESARAAICCRVEHEGEAIEIFIADHRIKYAARLGAPDPNPNEPAAALRAQTEALVYESLSWRAGRVVLMSGVRLPIAAERADLDLSIAPLLLEGMFRLDQQQRITSGLYLA